MRQVNKEILIVLLVAFFFTLSDSCQAMEDYDAGASDSSCSSIDQEFGRVSLLKRLYSWLKRNRNRDSLCCSVDDDLIAEPVFSREFHEEIIHLKNIDRRGAVSDGCFAPRNSSVSDLSGQEEGFLALPGMFGIKRNRSFVFSESLLVDLDLSFEGEVDEKELDQKFGMVISKSRENFFEEEESPAEILWELFECSIVLREQYKSYCDCNTRFHSSIHGDSDAIYEEEFLESPHGKVEEKVRDCIKELCNIAFANGSIEFIPEFCDEILRVLFKKRQKCQREEGHHDLKSAFKILKSSKAADMEAKKLIQSVEMKKELDPVAWAEKRKVWQAKKWDRVY